jgi:hypothetical protein
MPGCMGARPASATAAPAVPEPAIPWESAWPAITRISVAAGNDLRPIQFFGSALRGPVRLSLCLALAVAKG